MEKIPEICQKMSKFAITWQQKRAKMAKLAQKIEKKSKNLL